MALDQADLELGAACRRTAEAAGDALGWIGDNQDKLGSERAALERQLRKSVVTANKLAAAAERPMCVGVFGPSQAGKSYLISALARPGQEDLVAEFEGVPGGLSFVRHINPQGGGEATGLVTRFTLKDRPTPKGFPVAFRLLSEMDVVKILANTYLSDFKDEEEKPASAEALRAAFESVRGQVQPAAQDRLSIDDFYDLREYVDKYFRGHEFVKALGPAYWGELERIGPYLPAPARQKLLAFLWGNHEFFTTIYRRLQAALAQLDFAAEAFAPISALRDADAAPNQGPRRDSIIDVNTLYALAESEGEAIEVARADGRAVSLPRPVVTALIAELTIRMQKQPWPFFSHTDLLDFPGARVRENYTVRQVETNRELVPKCFLRGKVAYLFERYCAELELTSMLLCIGPSNQEVRTLPKMIEDWVDSTHGGTPEERRRQETMLFFVLTKFDTEFDEKAGKLDPSLAFDTRLRHSLTEFFGATGEWVGEWHPGEPFKNCYWLRSPNAYAEGLFQFSADKRELALHPQKAERLAEIKPHYLATELVQRHIAEPDRAWEEGLKLNDGGVGYLAERLEPVCRPAIKRRQVTARIVELAGQLMEALRPYFVSGDLDQEREKRLQQAYAALGELEGTAEEGQFGEFLHAFQLESDGLAELYLRVALDGGGNGNPGKGGEEAKTQAAAARPRGSGRLLGRLSGAPVPGAAPTPAEPAAPGDRRAERFARAVMENWIDEMRQAAQDEQLSRSLQLPGGTLAAVVGELAQAARRLALRERLAQRLQQAAGIPRQPKQASAAGALMASEAINRFVATLGFSDEPAERRPQARDAEGGERPIFTRPPMSGDFPDLPAERQPFNDQVVVDWMAGYLRLVEDNASTLEGSAIDIEQNRRLGSLLQALGGVRGAAPGDLPGDLSGGAG